jgi:hypothetical protein
VFCAERWTDLVVPLVSYLAWSVLAVLIDVAAVVKGRHAASFYRRRDPIHVFSCLRIALPLPRDRLAPMGTYGLCLAIPLDVTVRSPTRPGASGMDEKSIKGDIRLNRNKHLNPVHRILETGNLV